MLGALGMLETGEMKFVGQKQVTVLRYPWLGGAIEFQRGEGWGGRTQRKPGFSEIDRK